MKECACKNRILRRKLAVTYDCGFNWFIINMLLLLLLKDHDLCIEYFVLFNSVYTVTA